MKYLNKIIEYGLYLLVFLLPLQTRWIIKAGRLNNGPWEYGTYSVYGTDILLIAVLALFVIREIAKFIPSHGEGPAFHFLSPAMTEKKEVDCGSEPAMTEKRTGDNRMIWRFACGLVLVSAMSIFFAADKLLALYKFGWLILSVGLFWLVASANYNRLKLIYALLVGAFLQASLAVWQFLSQATFANKWLGLALHRGADLGTAVVATIGADGISERWLRAYGGLDHPNILGGLIAIAILLLINEMLRENYGDKIPNPNDQCTNKFPIPMANTPSYGLASVAKQVNSKRQKFFKFINWLLALVFTAGLLFSFSRSAWLALAVGLAVMIVLAVGRGNLQWQKGLAEIILVMGILWLVLFSQYQNLMAARLGSEGRLENKSNFERLASYQEAWQLIKNNWLFAVGPGNYTLALRNKIFPGQASNYYQPAHNVFMLVWVEAGILGIIFFVGVIIFAFVRLLRPDRSVGTRHDSGAAILIALAVLMFFDHWLFSLHFGVLFFWLVLGVIVTSKKIRN